MSTTDAPEVTITNYVRAETDFQMRGYIEQMDCFGRLVHVRAPYDVHHQVTVRANRDTPMRSVRCGEGHRRGQGGWSRWFGGCRA